MKWKEILAVPCTECPKGEKDAIRALMSEHYLILDVWENGGQKCRHAVNPDTGEYGTYYPGTGKTVENIESALGDGIYGYRNRDSHWYIPKNEAALIRKNTKDTYCDNGVLGRIASMERQYARKKREDAADARQRRLNELMSLCPAPGAAVINWIIRTENVGWYAFYDKETDTWTCSACGRKFTGDRTGLKKIRQHDVIGCPLCGSSLTAEKRKKTVSRKVRMNMIHNMDGKRGVLRHFVVEFLWNGGGRRVYLDEQIRLMMQRGMKHSVALYYADGWGDWSTGNRANRCWRSGRLYPDGQAIREGLAGTAFQIWEDVFPQLAAAGIKADYNGLLCESNHYWTGIAEYLAKGRFYRLLDEETQRITAWSGYIGKTLNVLGNGIGEVLKLSDGQLINRLRQENGGRLMLGWLQWSERHGSRITAECMGWLHEAGLPAENYEGSPIAGHLTPQQLMNYIIRQKKESYPKLGYLSVLKQYEDYLDMAARLGKNMDDEMVYRPRELKRRHDEAVEELRRKQNAEAAAREAERMRQKYPGYEDILEEVSRKYGYASGDYLIRVPKDFAEITAEGMALHHCVGHTERYFDRIVSRETYICFLRRRTSPDEPFYTIEVEPGGTIRQHRGAYDEEPGIEEIKPFLREWQKVIRSRMSRSDHEYARQSEILRRKNIDELKRKNNIRVLDGLMEDLMEVI